MKLAEILELVKNEVLIAQSAHKPMHSPHEGYAVIREELDELWEKVKANVGHQSDAMDEAIQVAAMGVRYVLDLSAKPLARVVQCGLAINADFCTRPIGHLGHHSRVGCSEGC